MKMIRKIVQPLIAVALVFSLSSAAIAPVDPLRQPAKVENAPVVKYKELKSMATQLKGAKLTLKEKIGLRVFGKKIQSKPSSGGSKSQLVALLLCAFVGGLGIHRFYLGYTTIGIIQLLTLGGCGIWALIDLIRIITGDLKPADGDYDEIL